MELASQREPPQERIIQPFTGYVETTVNALRLIHAARQGVIPRITRRLNDNERRTMIKSGSVFVFGVLESGIRRWTDGLLWSPSRIVGNFLVYREITERASGRGTQRAKVAGHSQGALSPTDPGIFKPGGLLKKTITVTIEGADLHLISYFLPEEVRSGKLKRPSTRADIMSLPMDPQIFRLSNFRNPPKVEVGPNGKQRLVCEAEDQDVSDCRTFNEPTFGTIHSSHTKWESPEGSHGASPLDAYVSAGYHSGESESVQDDGDSSRWANRTYFKTESRDDHNLWLPPSPTAGTFSPTTHRSSFGSSSTRYEQTSQRRDSSSTTYSSPGQYTSSPAEPGWAGTEWTSSESTSAGIEGGEVYRTVSPSVRHHPYLSPLMLPPSTSRDGRYSSSSGQSQSDGSISNESGSPVVVSGRMAPANAHWNMGSASVSEVRISQRPMSSSSSHSQHSQSGSFGTHSPPPSTTSSAFVAGLDTHSPSSASSLGGYESPVSLQNPYQPMWHPGDANDIAGYLSGESYQTSYGSNGERGNYVKQEDFEQFSPSSGYHKL